MPSQQLHVRVYVSARDALLAGDTRAGEQLIPITAALLSELSTPERKVLADHSEGGNKTLHLPNAAQATIIAALRFIAQEQAAEQAEQEAKALRLQELLAGPREGRLAYNRDKPVGRRWIVSDEFEDLTTIASKERANAHKEARRTNADEATAHDAALLEAPVEDHVRLTEGGNWEEVPEVRESYYDGATSRYLYPRARERATALAAARNKEQHAAEQASFDNVVKLALSAEQWERYQAGVLPNSEKDEAMCALLFGWWDGLPEYTAIQDEEIEHNEDCCERETRHRQRSSQNMSDLAMKPREYVAAKIILSAWQNHPQLHGIEWVRHYADCPACDGEVVRFAARVKLLVSRNMYSRDYAIG
jgi:hypothetical protein